MPTTPLNINYTVLYDGRSEVVDQKSVNATMKFKVAWTDRWTFLRELCGTALSTGGSNFIRLFPAQYPDNKQLYCIGAECEPAGGINCTYSGSVPSGTYDWAIITAQFSTLPYDFGDAASGGTSTVYRTISMDISSHVMTLPEDVFHFATGTSVKPTLSPGMLIPQCEIGLTSHQVPYFPIDDILSLTGTINNAPFYGAAAETLMFLGASASRQSTSDGTSAWEVGYKFCYRPVSWNKFWSPKLGVGWDYLLDYNGNPIYALSDFTLLP